MQPDDDFCANCGVNIKLYRRNHEGSGKSKSWTLYILTFCLVGVLIGFLIFQFYNPKKMAKIAQAEQKSIVAQTVETKPVAQTTSVARDEAPEQEATPPPVEGNKMAALPTPAEEKKAEEKFTIDALEVHFLEVSKSVLAQMTQEGTVLSDTAASTALWFAGSDNKNSLLQKGQAVTAQIYRQANPGETSPLKILYQGGIKANDEILYQMQVMPKMVDSNRTRVHISATMKWLIDEGEVKASTSSSFDSTYAVTGPGQLVLIGILPAGKRPSAVTRGVLGQTPLGILNSDNFHKKASEFVVIISIH